MRNQVWLYLLNEPIHLLGAPDLSGWGGPHVHDAQTRTPERQFNQKDMASPCELHAPACSVAQAQPFAIYKT